jgi:hypothetical protein
MSYNSYSLERKKSFKRSSKKATDYFSVGIKDDSDLPTFFINCVNFLEEHALDEEGILRIHGRTQDTNAINAFLSSSANDKRSTSLGQVDPHAVATLLKSYLNQGPPLLPMEQYSTFVQIGSKKEANGEVLLYLREVIAGIPLTHQRVLHRVLIFIDNVQQHSGKNKMDAKALSIIFNPLLLRAASDVSPALILSQTQSCINFVHLLITNYQTIFEGIGLNFFDSPISPIVASRDGTLRDFSTASITKDKVKVRYLFYFTVKTGGCIQDTVSLFLKYSKQGVTRETGQTKALVCTNPQEVVWEDVVPLEVTLVVNRRTKVFDPRNFIVTLKCDTPKGSKTLGAASINLAELSPPTLQTSPREEFKIYDMMQKGGKSKRLTLHVKSYSEWRKINNKLVVRQEDSGSITRRDDPANRFVRNRTALMSMPNLAQFDTRRSESREDENYAQYPPRNYKSEGSITITTPTSAPEDPFATTSAPASPSTSTTSSPTASAIPALSFAARPTTPSSFESVARPTTPAPESVSRPVSPLPLEIATPAIDTASAAATQSTPGEHEDTLQPVSSSSPVVTPIFPAINGHNTHDVPLNTPTIEAKPSNTIVAAESVAAIKSDLAENNEPSLTLKDSTGVPKEPTLAPVDSVSTHGDSAPTPRDSAPTPTDSVPTPRDSAPTPRDSSHAPKDSIRTPRDSAPTPRESRLENIVSPRDATHTNSTTTPTDTAASNQKHDLPEHNHQHNKVNEPTEVPKAQKTDDSTPPTDVHPHTPALAPREDKHRSEKHVEINEKPATKTRPRSRSHSDDRHRESVRDKPADKDLSMRPQVDSKKRGESEKDRHKSHEKTSNSDDKHGESAPENESHRSREKSHSHSKSEKRRTEARVKSPGRPLLREDVEEENKKETDDKKKEVNRREREERRKDKDATKKREKDGSLSDAAANQRPNSARLAHNPDSATSSPELVSKITISELTIPLEQTPARVSPTHDDESDLESDFEGINSVYTQKLFEQLSEQIELLQQQRRQLELETFNLRKCLVHNEIYRPERLDFSERGISSTAEQIIENLHKMNCFLEPHNFLPSFFDSIIISLQQESKNEVEIPKILYWLSTTLGLLYLLAMSIKGIPDPAVLGVVALTHSIHIKSESDDSVPESERSNDNLLHFARGIQRTGLELYNKVLKIFEKQLDEEKLVLAFLGRPKEKEEKRNFVIKEKPYEPGFTKTPEPVLTPAVALKEVLREINENYQLLKDAKIFENFAWHMALHRLFYLDHLLVHELAIQKKLYSTDAQTINKATAEIEQRMREKFPSYTMPCPLKMTTQFVALVTAEFSKLDSETYVSNSFTLLKPSQILQILEVLQPNKDSRKPVPASVQKVLQAMAKCEAEKPRVVPMTWHLSDELVKLAHVGVH